MSAAVPPGACDCHTHVFGPYARFPLDPDRPYTPPEASLDALRAMHAALGVERVVLVAASPYGTDNAALLDALGRLGDAGRGVVALGADTSEETLAELHAAGVRGVRVNLASVGEADPGAAEAALRATAARVAPLGWHVGLHAGPATIAALRDAIAGSPAVTVVDHFGLPDPATGPAEPGFAALCALAAAGRAYVKLSAPERFADDPDGTGVAALARALLDAAPDAMLWASDWPHTGGGPHGGGARDPATVEPFRAVDDARALARLREWAGDDEAALRRVLVANATRLYDF